MKHFLEKHSTRKNILILLGIVLIIEVLFGILLPKGDNAIMIDMAGSTSSVRIYEIIANYDADMKQAYITGAFTLDLIFPIAYFLLFALLLFTYWKKTWMIFLPLMQAICDLCENTGIVIMLRSWPEQLTGLANTIVIVSWLKWGLAGITVTLIMIGLIRSVINKRRNVL